jgi:trigger factor
MQTMVEKREKSTVMLEVTIPAAEFDQAVDRAYVRERNRFNVQGFRRGHAPRRIIERMYGEDTFYEGAVDAIAPEVLQQGCEEHSLELIGRPTLDVVHAKEGEDLKLAFTFAVYPEIKLGEYKGLTVTRVPSDVPKSRVEAELEAAREARARYIEADRPIAVGDRIVFDYKGKVDGEYFEGGEAQNAQLDIGSNRFIPGFEEAMVGIAKGEASEISVRFPDEYHAEELKGKDAVFEVVVHEIREKELPDIDDDLAMDATEFDTLEQWREDIQKRLEDEAQRQARNVMQNELLEKAAENATFQLPDAMVDSQVDSIIRDYATRLSYQGIDLEHYMGHAGLTMAQMRADVRPDAERRVKNQLVLDEITKTEEIKATPQEVSQRIAELAERYNMSVEKFEEGLTDHDRGHIEEDAAIEKTLRFLMDNAVVVEPEEKDGETPQAEEPADGEAEG